MCEPASSREPGLASKSFAPLKAVAIAPAGSEALAATAVGSSMGQYRPGTVQVPEETRESTDFQVEASVGKLRGRASFSLARFRGEVCAADGLLLAPLSFIYF